MSNLNAVLNDQIRRLARREIRANTKTIKKATGHYRRDIAALKRQVAQLSKKFFIDVQGEDGATEKALIRLRKSCVVVSVPCLKGTIAKVAFMKTSRSKNFRDSREPKKYISGAEVKEELRRLLRDDHAAEEAWRALQV